ncbi:MAG: hypothetical protein JXR51_10480 [Bacteroidales bacterium]|nr:hypothetical protein [Bacteroidales bacterium]MBN2757592.1 hypothetical protein [Bacteroidales bacterium]
MANCICLPKCPFFNDKMANMPSMSNLIKTKYCQGESSECARYIVYKAIGSENVPSDLFPNQVDRAKEILNLE